MAEQDKAKKKTSDDKFNRKGKIYIFFALAIFVFGFIENWTKSVINNPLLFWAAFALGIILFLIGLGVGTHDRWDGVLIDSRNKISLSRLQIGLWTILIISALIAIVFPRAIQEGRLDSQVDVKYYNIMLEEDKEQNKNEAVKCFPNAAEEVQEQKNAQKEKTPAEDADTSGTETQPSESGQQEEGAATGENDTDEGTTQPAVGEQQIMVTVAEDCRDPYAINLPAELITVLGISTGSAALAITVKSNKTKKSADIKSLEDNVKELETKAGEAKKANAEALEDAQKGISDYDLKKKEVDSLKGKKQTNAVKTKISEAEKELAGIEKVKERYLENTRQTKKTLKEVEKAASDASKKLDEKKMEIEKGEGVSDKNIDPSQAAWIDLFMGEEIGNKKYVDMGKVQLFYITLVIIIGYGASIYQSIFMKMSVLQNPLGLSFPAISGGLTTLLGLSHAGYLAVKNADHTPTEK